MGAINLLKDRRGLTILEVLIASAVFMIGFAIMFFLLSEIVGKYSAKEKIIAYHLAQEYMENSLASDEFSNAESVETNSNISFKIKREIIDMGQLKGIRVTVSREKTGKLLVSFYDEKYIRKSKILFRNNLN